MRFPNPPNPPLQKGGSAQIFKKDYTDLGGLTKESIIEKTYRCENLPRPLFAKEGKVLPLQKGGQEGFGPRHPYYWTD